MCGLDSPSLYKILRKNRLELSNSKPVSLRSLSCSNRLPKRPEHAESLHRRFIPKRFPSFSQLSPKCKKKDPRLLPQGRHVQRCTIFHLNCVINERLIATFRIVRIDYVCSF